MEVYFYVGLHSSKEDRIISSNRRTDFKVIFLFMVHLLESRLKISPLKSRKFTCLAIIEAPCQTEYFLNGFSVTETSIGGG